MSSTVVETLHVVSGVLVHPARDGRVLMALRDLLCLRPSLWEFPGGKVDPGDPGARSALAREWREELELDVDAGERIATGIVHADVHVLIELFEVIPRRPFSDPETSPASLVHASTRWIRPADAVRSAPCSPAFYVHYPFLALWIQSQEEFARHGFRR